MSETPQQSEAHRLRDEMVEVLKFLNRAEEEEADVPGYELSELLYFLQHGPFPTIAEADAQKAVDLLVANGLASVLRDERYSWERRRTVGIRYIITLAGKEFLLKQLDQVERIE